MPVNKGVLSQILPYVTTYEIPYKLELRARDDF